MPKQSCATGQSLSAHTGLHEVSDNRTDLHKRQSLNTDALINRIGNSEGCPTTRRVALVGIATDCTYTASFNSTESVRRNLINVVNTASEVFERTFNISLGLHNVTISDSVCSDRASDATPWNAACSDGNMDGRLRQFTSWRQSLQDSTNAYWTLMTGCPTRGEVGVSWVGQLCNPQNGVNVVAQTSNEWQVFAHESAHTFGAVHDCTADTCSSGQCCPRSTSTCDANAQYLMNPFSASSQSDFSPCTVGNVCGLIGSGNVLTRCLISNRNVPTITANECGNGIVEEGEDSALMYLPEDTAWEQADRYWTALLVAVDSVAMDSAGRIRTVTGPLGSIVIGLW
ncbi:ADAM metallopeptidase domain [Aspergillus tanneri]|uniref:ADAM metallopeptidase domain n=1 Tax=Aspergillus tanneri TaxID=1220188 RepID=A0A5M9MRQ7_9EURO|nr:ADAM metallopeptidase domain [Aspergillus tanneri]KAA8647990.1 ADAM metallopeptidase domain [Aspergillus tanneri]